MALMAQLEDEFSDGNFDSNPTWVGNTNSFIVENEILSLNAVAAGTAYLSTPVNISDSTSWNFWLDLDLNPSATGNFPKIVLSSDNSDLSAPFNGYFLRIGESNANDAFELYRQEGTDEFFLLRFNTEGEMGASSNNIARINITRNDIGLWRCSADYSGGSCFVSEGTITDNTFTSGSHFGFFCKYTVTNISNFAFDDVYIDLPAPGVNNPLSVENLNPLELTDLELHYSKTVDPITAETVGNYTIQDAGGTIIGNPITVSLDASDNSLVHIDISNLTINSNETYNLVVNNVLDCSGNTIGANNSLPFQILITEAVAPFDILINEIFAAPSTTIASLPNAEFVELYNRSNKAINLEDFIFSDASSEKMLTAYVMPANSYLILCDTDNEALYTTFGDVLPINGFPGLNNAGDELTLKDDLGTIIHEAFYTSAWYQDTEKDDGGWSLELGNPELYCQGSSNWSASNNPVGGTPGIENSTFNDAPDAESPKLIGAVPLNENQLRLFFNEIIDANLSTSLFQLSGAIGSVENVLLESPENTSILITIGPPFFQDNTTYTISLQAGLTDCSGNVIDANFDSLDFSYFIAEAAEPYDILINEIFADPTPAIGLPEAEYIELYNRSTKNINLADFILSDRSDEILLPNYLLRAGGFVILYEGAAGSFGVYEDTLALEEFVGLGNTEDDLTLVNPAGEIIHAVNYNISWYQDSGKSDGGWSLELINPSNYCEVETNWRASVNPTGGTPAMGNSVLESTPDETPLDLICAYPNSPTQINLFFNKAIEADAILTSFNMDGFTIEDISITPPLFNTAVINISPGIVTGEIYSVSVQSALTDCRGNSVGQFNEVQIALPDVIAPNDVVINEILFNPEVGGSDFVELFNRSNKVIDPADLFLASRDELDSIVTPEIITSECLLFPSDYLVLTENVFDIQSRYMNTAAYSFVQTNLPTYEDKGGTVVLYLPVFSTALVIDQFSYMESMQYPLLSNKNGVSLERINPSAPTQSDNNWHSAAEEVGYATPTYQNSQFIAKNASTGDDLLWLETNRLSPDNDGFEDFLQIQYILDRPGYAANLRIFDSKGRLIKILTENELLLTEGNIKWDGVDDEGARARTGVHILEAKLTHPDGNVEQYRLAFVVASRLD